MEEEEKEEYDKAIWSFASWIILGFLMLIDPLGMFEIDWAFAIMSWFSAFLSLLRFRYRRYDDRFWLEEIMENVVLVGFATPGVILGLYFFNPWIMAAISITGMSIWFMLWRLYFEDLVHSFWL